MYLTSMLVPVLVGAVKEIYDHAHPDVHTADWWDFVATAVPGVILSAAVVAGGAG